ncbi:hypothetical protein [Natronosalvus amylolyticus]|uniref:hypothetical protein n=1 Tax=Natronosalvus amylolyticus TaxID=2961994 RepID=UPI0020C9D173|nr:hypothetical protein [Natronosalvus amylolyticus]
MTTSSTDVHGHVDTVEETWHDRQMGVKVEQAVRKGYEEDQTLLKVYRLSRECYRSLETGEPEEVEQYEKIGEFTQQTATEILFGLAEAHGYNLEGQ